MKTVKNHCKKCGHAEELTRKDKIMFLVKKVLYGFLLALGIVLLFLMIIVGPIKTLESLSTTMMIGFATSPDEREEIRDITIKAVGSCPYTDTFCYAYGLFSHLNHLEYVPASLLSPIQTPLYTYEKSGDCKNTAILYTTMLRSIGVNAQVVCSIKYNHCVSRVPYNKDYYYIVDLTYGKDGFWIMNSDDDFWSYRYKQNFELNRY